TSALPPALARAGVPLQSVAAVAGIVGGAYAGIVLTRSGNTLALSGLPDHSLLTVGSNLLAVVAQRVTGGGAYGSFLWPDQRLAAGRYVTSWLGSAPWRSFLHPPPPWHRHTPH